MHDTSTVEAFLPTRDTMLCISLAARPRNIGTRFHNFLYRQLDLDYLYTAFTTDDVTAAIAGVRALGIRGCSVSMPFKEAVIPLLDAIDDSAAAIESVNTIVNDHGTLIGYNTDYLAIRALLASNQIPASTSVVVRGSGGMAKAVTAALRDSGFSDVTIVARNETTGAALARSYGYHWAGTSDQQPGLLINATPLGMEHQPGLPFTSEQVAAARWVLDVIAMPAKTALLDLADRHGATTIPGTEVIALQAAEQFIRYTGIEPPAELIAAASRFSREEPGQ
ncbi:shikimate 5-dehydrogenase [Hoyosella sp. G463]|uniref:Shikimate 5-dehydrogenase n=1 Tax=Lolliginicoccus lacisalsi TaxID=2742202 RepID=A0A927PLH6_9ACTN|nr:shikimate 5-dehydrogenase [Lolliginicoccus lacisalsi]MBD8506838.1 shikimate 5-dehydrogenase [Lolliginicoccus lacisalsi]